MTGKSGSRQRRVDKLQRKIEELEERLAAAQIPFYELPAPELEAMLARVRAQNPLLAKILEVTAPMLRRESERNRTK
jgi:hypothetical protein